MGSYRTIPANPGSLTRLSVLAPGRAPGAFIAVLSLKPQRIPVAPASLDTVTDTETGTLGLLEITRC